MSDYYLQSGRAAPVKIQESAAFWPSTIQHLTRRRSTAAWPRARFGRLDQRGALDHAADIVTM
jgi:hypothetical protein